MPTPPEIKTATDRIIKAALNAWLLASHGSDFHKIVKEELERIYRAGQKNITHTRT